MIYNKGLFNVLTNITHWPGAFSVLLHQTFPHFQNGKSKMMRNFPPKKLAISVPYLWLLNDALILESLEKKGGHGNGFIETFFCYLFYFFYYVKAFFPYLKCLVQGKLYFEVFLESSAGLFIRLQNLNLKAEGTKL